jgi:hypothetical protein
MFAINSYIWFRNTPDGKPRVLREEVDYDVKTLQFLLEYEDPIAPLFHRESIANLSDCRPLLSVEIDGKVWTEGDILNDSNTRSQYSNYIVRFEYENSLAMQKAIVYLPKSSNIGSFFDDPAKYSQLLWNCSEEEGWNKVLGLLGVDKQLLTK